MAEKKTTKKTTKKTSESEAKPKALVTTAKGDNIKLPPRKPKPKPTANTEIVAATLKMTPQRSIRGAVGHRREDAFAAFCREQGVRPEMNHPDEVWNELLRKFEERPIHGHRRSTGGTHRRSR